MKGIAISMSVIVLPYRSKLEITKEILEISEENPSISKIVLTLSAKSSLAT